MGFSKAVIVRLFILGAAGWIAGAGAGDLARASAAGPEKGPVTITATSFKFEPSVIETSRSDTLALKIMNASSASHNFTVRDTDKNILRSVDLPPGETVTVELPLQKEGVYEFYCDKPFHSAMGMKGRIEVGPSP